MSLFKFETSDGRKIAIHGYSVLSIEADDHGCCTAWCSLGERSWDYDVLGEFDDLCDQWALACGEDI